MSGEQCPSSLTFLPSSAHTFLGAVSVLRNWPWLVVIQCSGHVWEEGWPGDSRVQSREVVECTWIISRNVLG